MRNKKQIMIFALAALIVLAVVNLTSCVFDEADGGSDVAMPAEGSLTMYFLDVGQADSTLLVSQGETMLIDAGNRDDDDFIISYLNGLGIDRLDYIIFTHPHEDHIGAGEAIIEAFDVGKIFFKGPYSDGIEGYLSRAIENRGIHTEEPVPGEKLAFGECEIEFLGPFHDFKDDNDDSICLKVRHGENVTMFTGDAGSGPEREIIESGADFEADLFQAGHHGSSTSNSYYFLREMNPRYIVISCGEDNMYGHPHEEALSRFNDLGADVFRTDEQGTVIAVDDGQNITFNCEGKKADRPYTEDYDEAEYIGNLNSKKYHAPDCRGLPQEENRIYFTGREVAEDAGYEPCGMCNP